MYFGLQLLTTDGVQQSFKYVEGKLEDNPLLRAHRARDARFQSLVDAMRDMVRRGAPAPKLLKLEEILGDHFARHDPEQTRVIIFADRRETVRDINDVLKKHAPRVRSTEFKGQASGRNNKGQSQKRQQAVLREFRSGAFNVIVSTSIGEEGLDIGEVDLVLCFDASASPLRMIQRMGRTGRKRQGRVVILASLGKEVRDYEKNQAKMRSVQRKMQNGGQDFEKHPSPRMVPHAFRPTMRTVIMDIPEYIHRGNKTVRTPLLVDPGTEELGAEERATLARWPSPSWSPSLIAFSNFQSQPSKVHKIRHASRTTELFVGVLQRLQNCPPETGLLLEGGSQELHEGSPKTASRLDWGLWRPVDEPVGMEQRDDDSDDDSDDVSDQGLDIFALGNKGQSKRGPKRARNAKERRQRRREVVEGDPPGNLDIQRRAERAGPGPGSIQMTSADGVQRPEVGHVQVGRVEGETFGGSVSQRQEDDRQWTGNTEPVPEGKWEKAPAAEARLPWSPPRPQFTPVEQQSMGEMGRVEGTRVGRDKAAGLEKAPLDRWNLQTHTEGDVNRESPMGDDRCEDAFGGWGEGELGGDTWQADEAFSAPRRSLGDEELGLERSGGRIEATKQRSALAGSPDSALGSWQRKPEEEQATNAGRLEPGPEAIRDAKEVSTSSPVSISAVANRSEGPGNPRGTKSSDETSSEDGLSAGPSDESSDEGAGESANTERNANGAQRKSDKTLDGKGGDLGVSDGEADRSDGKCEETESREDSHSGPLQSLSGSRGTEDAGRKRVRAREELPSGVNQRDKRIKVTSKRSRESRKAAKQRPGNATGELAEGIVSEKVSKWLDRTAEGSQKPSPLADLSPNVGHGGSSRSLEDLPLAAQKRKFRARVQSPGSEATPSKGSKGREGENGKALECVSEATEGEGKEGLVEGERARMLDGSEKEQRAQPGAELEGGGFTEQDGSSDVEDLPLATRLGNLKAGRLRKKPQAESGKMETEGKAEGAILGQVLTGQTDKSKGGIDGLIAVMELRVSGVDAVPKGEGGAVLKEGADRGKIGWRDWDCSGLLHGSRRETPGRKMSGNGSMRLGGSQQSTGVRENQRKTNGSSGESAYEGAETCPTAEGTGQSQKRAPAKPSGRFDADAVVPDSESEEEDTWRPLRYTGRVVVNQISSQRNGMTGRGKAEAVKRRESGLQQQSSKAPVIEAPVGTDANICPAISTERNEESGNGRSPAPVSGPHAPRSQLATQAHDRASTDRSLDPKERSRLSLPDAMSPGANTGEVVPESPDSETRAFHALSSQVRSPIAYEGLDCRVPETPDSEEGTAGVALERHVSAAEAVSAQPGSGAAEDNPEEGAPETRSPRSSSAPNDDPSRAVESGTEQRNRSAAAVVGPERGLKPVPFPGFSPMPSRNASPYAVRGNASSVVPETPDSGAAQNQATSQRNGVPDKGDLGNASPLLQSPVPETPPPGLAAQNPFAFEPKSVKSPGAPGLGFPAGWSPVPETPPSSQSGTAAQGPVDRSQNGANGQGDSRHGVPLGWSPVPETPPDAHETVSIFGRPSRVPIGRGSQSEGRPQGFGSPYQGSNWLGSEGVPQTRFSAIQPAPSFQAQRGSPSLQGQPPISAGGALQFEPNTGRDGIQQNGIRWDGMQRDANFPVRRPLPKVSFGNGNPHPACATWHGTGLDQQQAATCPPSERRDASVRPICPPVAAAIPLNPETLRPSPSQWERLNASLKEQFFPPVETPGFNNLVSPNPVETTGFQNLIRPNRAAAAFASCADATAQPPSHALTSADAVQDVSYHHLPVEARAPWNPPHPASASLGINVNAPPPPSGGPFTPPGSAAPQPGVEGPVRQASPASHRSSGEWLPTSQAPTGPPSAEPPRKLRRLRKAKSGSKRSPERILDGTEGDVGGMERGPRDPPRAGGKAGRKQAMQSLAERGKGQARNLASIFFDEEAEVSGDEAASSDESGDGPEEDDSFIDDRSQVTASAAATTPSAGTGGSPGDMMALYRRSLLTQSPLEDASPLNAPRFKSPPRAQANKNYGKMVFRAGRRISGQSEEAEEASLEYEESLESGEETGNGGKGAHDEGLEGDRRASTSHVPDADWSREGASGKQRKLAFADGQKGNNWTSWQIGDGKEQGGRPDAAGGWGGHAASTPSAPQERIAFSSRPCPANPEAGGAVGQAADRCHVAAPENGAPEDDFLEGLDLDRLEAEALAARSQQPQPQPPLIAGHPNGEAQSAAAQILARNGVAGFVGIPRVNGFGADMLLTRELAGAAMAKTQNLTRERVPQLAPSCGRLRKRRSLVNDDSMPSFDLGLD